MASGGIKIPFIADVANFLRGTQDVETALDDVSTSLDDLARESQQSAEKVGHNLSEGIGDGVKDADTELGKLEKSLKDALDEVGPASKKAGDDLGHNIKHGTHEAVEGTKDLKENAKQNLKETASSFQSAGDAVQGFQGFVAEALEGFGPLGAAAGAAAAIGIGIAAAAFQKQSQKIKDLAASLTQALIDDGGKLAEQSIISRIKDFADDGSIIKLQDQAQKAHVSVNDFIRALAGDPAALERARAQVDAYEHSVDLTAQGTNKFKDEGAIAFINKQLDDQSAAAGIAAAAMGAYSDVTASTATGSANAAEVQAGAAKTQTKAAQEAADALAKQQSTAEAYAATLQSLADPVSEFTDLLATSAKKAPPTIEKMIKDMTAKAGERKNFENNLRILAKKGMDEGLIQELEAKGPDAAGAVVKVLAKGTGTQVKAYAAAHMAAVGETGAKGMGAAIAGHNLAPSIQTAVDKGAAKVKPPQVPVDAVLGSTRSAESDYAAFVRSLERKYPLTINVRGGNKPIPGGPQI